MRVAIYIYGVTHTVSQRSAAGILFPCLKTIRDLDQLTHDVQTQSRRIVTFWQMPTFAVLCGMKVKEFCIP